MNLTELSDVITRHPFRPYTLRLTNGATYEVREPRDLGAPGDLRILHWFERAEPFRVVRIEPDSITEIIE